MNLQEIPQSLSIDRLSIGIVVSNFNPEITEVLLKGAMKFLNEHDTNTTSVTVMHVAGALEIPLALARMAQTDGFDVLVALGAVIKGETYHFELVSNESAAGVSRVTHDFDIAVGNGILTTYTEEQAAARAEQKGDDAVAAAVELHNATVQLDS
jgi:6,7-dimethyl-8-ribityllumazine synthase